MLSFLERFEDPAYALLRIMSGAMFLGHGVQKFFNFPVEFPWPLNPMTTAAAAIELVGGVLLIIGLFTRPVAFLCSGMAAVGYWMVHGANGFYPIANGGETIALYCFIFLFIAARGPGIWGIDKKD